MPPGFERRACPCCGSAASSELFDLEAAEFCAINWTYDHDYRQIQSLGPEARFPIDRCQVCGFVYARWLPSPEFLNKLYDEVIVGARAEEAARSLQDIARRMAYLGKLLRLFEPQQPIPRVLDFGCGFGKSAELLAGCGLDVVAFETSPLRIQALKRGSAGLRVTMTWSDLQAAAPFYAIVLDNVLEHLPHPAATLSSLAALCAPAAIVYVSVPSYEEVTLQALAKTRARAGLADKTLNPWEHLNYFDLVHLDALMQRHGFRPLAARDLVAAPDIGLRPESEVLARITNGLASALRLARFVAAGRAVETVGDRFYRLASAC